MVVRDILLPGNPLLSQASELESELSTSELLQHEIDHLDGVLVVAKAVDGSSFALRSQRCLVTGAAFANC